MNAKFSDIMPGNLEFESAMQKEEMAKQVKEFHFGDKHIGDYTILAYIVIRTYYYTKVIFAYMAFKSRKISHISSQ